MYLYIILHNLQDDGQISLTYSFSITLHDGHCRLSRHVRSTCPRIHLWVGFRAKALHPRALFARDGAHSALTHLYEDFAASGGAGLQACIELAKKVGFSPWGVKPGAPL